MPPPKKLQTEYEKVRAVWYKKLKDEGFDDIESDENNLKTWSSRLASKKSQELWQAKEAYYYMATNFLIEYPFATSLERIIWEYHAEAISVRDIVKLLKKARFKKINSRSKVNRNAVWEVISRLETAMKRMYLSGYESRSE